MKHRVLGIALGMTLALGACEQQGEEPAEGADTLGQAADTVAAATLYDRLGGEAAIAAVVDTLVALASADAELNFTRQGTANEWEATPENVALFKTRMVQFVGQATGGPQVYEGQDMATAHAGMQITDEEFDRLAGHLEAALDAYDVPETEKQELFAIVETTRSAIVAPADTAAM
ncbi:MAG TPA: group 1 truncated hemoglobin [Gemmatimonadota bacterium]|nr:group 1 truncated hemoglobin [Gemmatimonadota bacterium]